MKRLTTRFATILMLGVLCLTPALAGDLETQGAAEPTQAVFNFEEPLFTPMEGSQSQGLITVEDLRRIHFIRVCEPGEVVYLCPPGCEDCLVTATKVYCFGCP